MELYNRLMSLVESNEAFLKIDNLNYEDGRIYRIFSYRLASYTDFCLPSALEARGIMFRLPLLGEEHPVLVSRPFQKFFNLDENPFTMGLDLSKVVSIADKRDGSLISTYLNANGDLRFKSKQSINSSQASDALRLLDRVEMKGLKDVLYLLAKEGFTVNLEYTSPTNRIVLGYPQSDLRIIGVRSNLSGDLIPKDLLKRLYSGFSKVIHEKWVDTFSVPVNMSEYLDYIKDSTGIEGIVMQMTNGQLVKFKSDWYKSLHLAKESIDFPRRLFECVIDEAVDDLKSMFSEDEVTMARIREMENLVIPKFNHYVAMCDKFLEENRSLERKDFAVKGQAELPQFLFSMAMMQYLGKPIDWKGWAKKNIEIFGVREKKENEGNE